MRAPDRAAAAISGDTIVAQSTAAGRSAVALIRLSGPRAHEIARRHLRDFPTAPRIAALSAFLDDAGELIDQSIATRYDSPHSYTGEDLVEISTHGGFVTPVRVIEQLILSGARQAEPGEFTQRAFLNGKLDLLQVEAIGDLIDSTSRAMARAAVRQLDRGLSRRIEQLRDSILHVEALLAYDIDFPEEDEGPISRDRIIEATADVRARLADLLATAPAGEMLREGAVVVIAGPPNVGKSSLFNALIGRARAIVTDIPGTTRDALEAVIEGPRWPLRLVDTAGLRQTNDVVERLGVELSESHVREAEVVLACGDSAQALSFTVGRVAELTSGTVIAVRTKADLGRQEGESAEVVAVSAETGDGLRALLGRIDEELARRSHAPEADTPVLTRARHRLALERALAEVNEFAEALQRNELPATVIATHLRAATGALEELIGVVDVEDVLGRVFAEFCVGK